jgi:hypothetical protein
MPFKIGAVGYKEPLKSTPILARYRNLARGFEKSVKPGLFRPQWACAS